MPKNYIANITDYYNNRIYIKKLPGVDVKTEVLPEVIEFLNSDTKYTSVVLREEGSKLLELKKGITLKQALILLEIKKREMLIEHNSLERGKNLAPNESENTKLNRTFYGLKRKLVNMFSWEIKAEFVDGVDVKEDVLPEMVEYLNNSSKIRRFIMSKDDKEFMVLERGITLHEARDLYDLSKKEYDIEQVREQVYPLKQKSEPFDFGMSK